MIPKKIISLVPSQTELLFYLGLNEEVIGITKFCVHPQEWFHSKTKIGGTKNINTQKIKLLQPNLILANKEENVKEQIKIVEKIAPIYLSDVNTFDDALEMIKTIGTLTNKEQASKKLITEIQNKFSQLTTIQLPLITCCYLIWKEPYLTVGGNTFINAMLQKCGFKNIFEDEKRYPEISLKQLSSLNCEYLLLSSEPYPFQQKNIAEIQSYLPKIKIVLVDGEMFSWYGSRMLQAADYFKQIINKINFIQCQ